jgi:hypothetical protein
MLLALLHPRHIHQVQSQLHFGPLRPTLAPPPGSSSTLNLPNRSTDQCLDKLDWLDLHLNLSTMQSVLHRTYPTAHLF